MMHIKKISSGSLLLVLSFNTYALEYDVELSMGFDSNPFEFSESFLPESDRYTELDLRFRQEITEGLRAAFKVQSQSYGDQSNADHDNTALKLDYALKSSLVGRDVKYRFDVEYNVTDNTYVSKNLGQIGETSNGDLIPDRYDSVWLDYRARADIELSDNIRLDVNVIGRSKNYENLLNLNLSSLDYSQWLFEPELRYSSGDKNLFKTKITTGKRSYDNRNGRDLLGIFVPSSQLEYDFQGIKLGWRYRPSNAQQFRIGYSYEKREDNVSGYFDATDNVLNLRYRNRMGDKQELRLDASYKDFSYDNNVNVTQSEIEEAIYTKEGFDFSISYAYLWSQTKYGTLWFNTRLGYENYDSVNANYIYDKSFLSLGINLEHP